MQNGAEISTTTDSISITDPESGQIMVSLLFMLTLFLLAMVGFAVDFTNLWFHRQAAQSAADSACQAGAMDMYMNIYDLASGLPPSNMGFTPGTAGDCSASSGAGTICFYANVNGYNGTGLSSGESNSVAWSFPSTVSGVTAPPISITTSPFLKVIVTENVRTRFLYSLGRSDYQKVAAFCTCGVVQQQDAAPMIVLNPTASGAFSYSGGGRLTIAGGPPRGLMVNSNSATAIACLPSAWIDTSKGGPQGTGSEVAAAGAVPQPTTCSGGGFNGGTTGKWDESVLPVLDPYAGVAAPTKPVQSTTASTPHVVSYGQDGCPDHSPTNYVKASVPHSGCLEYEPGYYPSAINLNANDVAIFKPGIYYMNGSLNIGGSDDVRLATPCTPSCSSYSTTYWQQTDGTMFYFLSGSLNINGGSGMLSSSRVDPVSSSRLTCDGNVPNASLGMPSTLNGNVLIGQCATNGTYWDLAGDTTDSRGNPGSRGLLVYQAHSNTTQPMFGGSGSLSFSGALYMHSTSFSDVLSMTGGASSGTFIIGQIVSDKVSLTGSGAINLALNPLHSSDLLKVAMLQ